MKIIGLGLILLGNLVFVGCSAGVFLRMLYNLTPGRAEKPLRWFVGGMVLGAAMTGVGFNMTVLGVCP